MPSDLPIIRVRTQQDIIEKIRLISKENNRSISKEVEFLIKQHIKQYESYNGKIEIKIKE